MIQIQIQHLGYEGSPALLKGTSLTLPKRKITVLQGTSGCGKSSLLEALAGLHKQGRQGNIEVTSYAPNVHWALLPQQPLHTFNPTRKVSQSLYDVLKQSKRTKTIEEELYVLQLEEVISYMHRYPFECSGGELQRAALAAAMFLEPTVLLLDEPTAAIDRPYTNRLIQYVSRWVEEGERYALVSTHQSIWLSDYEPITYYIYKGNIIAGQGSASKYSAVSKLHNGQSPEKQQSILYEIQGGVFSYRNRNRDFKLHLDAVIQEKQVIGISGLSGSGKSTLGQLIAGWKNWRSMKREYQNWDTLAKVQYIGQDPVAQFHPHQSIKFQLEAVWRRWQHLHTSCTSLSEYVEGFYIDKELLNLSIMQLSGGQRQRIQLARAFLPKPKLVLFDENLNALDVLSQQEYIKLLFTFWDIYSYSFVMISHQLDLLHMIADEIWIMKNGEIVDRYNPNKFDKNERSTVTIDLLQSYNI